MVRLGQLRRFPNLTLEELRVSLQDNLIALLNSTEFTDGEKSLARMFYAQGTWCGSHERALWSALFVADGPNLDRHAMGFPGEVAALDQWQNGDLSARFREWGVDL